MLIKRLIPMLLILTLFLTLSLSALAAEADVAVDMPVERPAEDAEDGEEDEDGKHNVIIGEGGVVIGGDVSIDAEGNVILDGEQIGAIKGEGNMLVQGGAAQEEEQPQGAINNIFGIFGMAMKGGCSGSLSGTPILLLAGVASALALRKRRD